MNYDQITIALTFIAFLIMFTVVGIYSAKYKQDTTTDYLLAGRQVNPWLTALSAMSTGQSGLLFTGQVGYAYSRGISAIWLVIGWAIGDYLAWWLIFRRLRTVSEDYKSDTVSNFLSQGKDRFIALVSALITIAFLGAYAAAQLVAGSKALHSVFGWNYYLGIIVGTVIVVIYCFSGGIRASIWTDAVQSVVMIVSLLLLLGVSIIAGGGLGNIWNNLGNIDANLTNLLPDNFSWGFLPFFLGWLVAGFGVVGQPHILVRAMAIDSADNVRFARDLKTVCGLVNSFAAIFIGLSARVLLPSLGDNDPELALLYMSLNLLPGILVGLMLAGLFAATISTADSQILSCSAALTQDVFPQVAKSYKFAKLGTLTVGALAFIIAISGTNNVFALITFSWSALASGLGVLLILRVFNKPVSTGAGIAMMLGGIVTAIVWNSLLQFSGGMYEVFPGMVVSALIYWTFSRTQ
ncbi:MAG: sodium/proline symporter [Xenococcaceae cyanobacterium MO_207.B15]|nr:sodium/proline symporter [Xenococcaceae cyanobacterium MO_207.B15]